MEKIGAAIIISGGALLLVNSYLNPTSPFLVLLCICGGGFGVLFGGWIWFLSNYWSRITRNDPDEPRSGKT